MEEVIAKKKNNLLLLYLLPSVFGLILIIIGIVSYFTLGTAGQITCLVFVLIGAVFWGGFIVFLAIFRRISNVLIARRGEDIFFPGYTCKIAELIDVSCRPAAEGGKIRSWGKITVMTQSGNITLDDVADLNKVQKKLQELMAQCRAAVAAPEGAKSKKKAK